MARSLEKKLSYYFVLIILIIGYLAWDAYSNHEKQQKAIQLVEHTEEVLLKTEKIYSSDYTIEASARGYLLTQNVSLLGQFNAAKDSVFRHIYELKQLTKDSAAQKERIETLQRLTVRKVDFSSGLIQLMQKEGYPAASKLVKTGEGISSMNEIRSILSEIQKEENQLLSIRKNLFSKTDSLFLQTVFVQLVIIILLLVLGYIVIHNSIKKKQDAQNKLKSNQRLLQSIIDNTSSYVYIKNANGNFLLVNKAYEKLFNKKREDIVGKTAYDLVDDEAANEMVRMDELCMQTRELVESENILKLHNEDYYFFSVRFPLYNEDGSFYGICGIITDITEIKKQSNIIKDLYDHAPCGYYSINDSGIIVNVNQTTLEWLGYSQEELIGKSFQEKILAPECLEEFERTFPVFKESGIVSEKEFIYVRKDGSKFPVLLNATAVKDDKGNFLFSRSTIFDITERKRIEEELQAANSELESFTYSVSHDLRAPLRIINGYAEIINDDYAPALEEQGKRMLKNISTNVNRMGQLIDDLLDFSRLGRREVNLHETNMNEIVASVLKDKFRVIDPKRYSVKVNKLQSCRTDSSLIKNVWENLISNAIKYSGKKEHPEIEIGFIKIGKENIYYVKDNGVGFDMKYYDKLFGVFQRLHKISDFEGTGVGLALAQRIVKKHHGTIWAEAQEGKGATFYFSIPQ